MPFDMRVAYVCIYTYIYIHIYRVGVGAQSIDGIGATNQPTYKVNSTDNGYCKIIWKSTNEMNFRMYLQRNWLNGYKIFFYIRTLITEAVENFMCRNYIHSHVLRK